MTRPDPSADLLIVCSPSLGAVWLGGSDGTWFCSGRRNGWLSGDDGLEHRRDFLTIGRAIAYARGCGWLAE